MGPHRRIPACITGGGIARAGAFLPLGAAVNVAVAWGFAMRTGRWDGTVKFAGGLLGGRFGIVKRFDAMGRTQCVCNIHGGLVMTGMKPDATLDEAVPAWGRIAELKSEGLALDPEILEMMLVDQASGWLARALWMGWSMEERPVQPLEWLRQTHWGITIKQPDPFFGYGGIGLPLHPLWPGFAINTAFYAAICWLLFAAPFVVRRRRRIKRGLCQACGYPVGTSDLCTECGKPVLPHRVGTVA